MSGSLDDFWACQSLTKESPVTISGLIYGRRVWVFLIGASWHRMIQLEEPQKRIKLESINISEGVAAIREMTNLQLITRDCCKNIF